MVERLSFVFVITVPFVGALGIEPRRCRARVGYSHARSHAGLRARKRRSRRGGFPGRLQIASADFSPVYASGAFPSYVVGCGSRLIPTTVPWPAKFAVRVQSRRAQTCPTAPWWHLDDIVDTDAIDMAATKRMLAWPRGEVNVWLSDSHALMAQKPAPHRAA